MSEISVVFSSLLFVPEYELLYYFQNSATVSGFLNEGDKTFRANGLAVITAFRLDLGTG
jgi:hypothetical protein